MASEPSGRHVEILSRVLDISTVQKGLLAENRVEELLALQQEREDLFSELRSLPPARYKEEPFKTILDGIRENDSVLMMSLGTMLSDVGGKIGKVVSGSKAAKAYSAGSSGQGF